MLGRVAKYCLTQLDLIMFGILLSSLVTTFDIWSAMQMLLGGGQQVQ